MKFWFQVIYKLLILRYAKFGWKSAVNTYLEISWSAGLQVCRSTGMQAAGTHIFKLQLPESLYDFFFPVALRPNARHGLLILEISRSHTTTHHNRYDYSGRGTSPSQKPLPDNTQHSQQTDIHALGGIRTHDLSRWAAADRRPRPRGYWDRHPYNNTYLLHGAESFLRS